MSKPSNTPNRVRLRVLGGTLELRDDVPKTRADCPKTRPCGHVRCRYHLWLELGAERRGPHFNALVPQSTLQPRWLEKPMPSSCALDVAESVPPGTTLPMAVIAKLLGKSTRWIRRIMRRMSAREREEIRKLLAP